jgi:putative transposase
LAADQKKARRCRATLLFTDESGFLLMPLIKTTLAPRGHTPLFNHRASHRDKTSAAAALTLSPVRGHIGLYYQTYPDLYVDAELYSLFLRGVLRQVRPAPVILLHDGGKMHRGPFVHAVQQAHAHRLLDIEPFPPYAPELNPTEGVWNYTKDKELANFAPRDLPALDSAVCNCLHDVQHDQDRLRSFFLATPLSWSATGLF